jgi:mono/diheme cytochrome c family protein
MRLRQPQRWGEHAIPEVRTAAVAARSRGGRRSRGEVTLGSDAVSCRRFIMVPTLVAAGVLAVALPVMAGTGPAKTEANGVYDGLASSHPGIAAAGKKVFIADCGRCHAMKAAHTTGTLGPNLDSDSVSYTNVVNAVVQGVGGIQAEYVIIKSYATMSQAQRAQLRKGTRVMTFAQLYDVAKFVTTARS